MPDRTRLRERIRSAGGLYLWLNTTLIRLAGPAHVSPNLPRNRDGDLCAHCGSRRDQHIADEAGTLACPTR